MPFWQAVVVGPIVIVALIIVAVAMVPVVILAALTVGPEVAMDGVMRGGERVVRKVTRRRGTGEVEEHGEE